MRRFPFIATIVAVALLATGVLGLRAASASADAQRSELRADAVQVTSAFQSYFERAASMDLLLAQNPAFTDFYERYGAARSQLARGGTVVAAMNRALAYLEILYPGSIGEACFIDDHGREIARVVNGETAPYDDLSLTEAANPFFRPTLAQPIGTVYQAAPYVSPDTKKWVISNSTVIEPSPGQRALVHFEVTLDTFRPLLQTALGKDYHAAIVDRKTGDMVLHSDIPVPPVTASASGTTASSWSRQLASFRGTSGAVKVDGHNGAFRHLETAAGNANDWAVVEWTTADPSVVPVWLGQLCIALGLLLLLLGLWELRRQHRALSAASRLDGLTGLGNRAAVHEALRTAIRDTKGDPGEMCGVLVLDLNGFKQINDVYGHPRGDALLQEVARRLHANVFEYDVPGRLGGDEFAVVLRRLAGDADALSVANRLSEALTRPIELDGAAHFVGVSIGAAIYPDHGMSPEELLRGADAAMYDAKRERGAPRLYRPGTTSGADDLEQAAELLAAIEHGEIVVHYQPEVSMRSGDVVGVEALARWQHPDRGTIPPLEFIPLAERVGLIRPLTIRVLDLALKQVKQWRGSGDDVSVSVNISALLLSDERIADDIQALLADHSVPPSALTAEITETALLADRVTAARVLGRLRALGVRIEIDDFGAGYASFGYLRDLPLDGVKLDRAFVSSQLADEDASGLLRATILTCHGLELEVIAEGIEDATSYARLRDMGCDTAQGYLIGRPAPAEQMRKPAFRLPAQRRSDGADISKAAS